MSLPKRNNERLQYITIRALRIAAFTCDDAMKQTASVPSTKKPSRPLLVRFTC